MRFRVDDPIFALFPEVRIAVLVARGVDNGVEDPVIASGLRAAAETLARELSGVNVAEHPRVAPWREAYRRFGVKPKKSRSSIESLMRRVKKGDALPSINPLVDLYNTVSLRHLVPVGGEDLARLEGDLVLAVAGPDEAPARLLGDRAPRTPYEGEVFYRDDVGAVCRRWNWKEADRTKLTPGTSDAVLVIEALPPIDEAALRAAATELAAAIEAHCRGSVSVSMVDSGNPEADLAGTRDA